MFEKISHIIFDADDTLWVNEDNFQKFDSDFSELMSSYMPKEQASKELLETEKKNIPIYGFGGKSMMLSMIETAARITGGQGDLALAQRIIGMGKALLQMPVVLLDGVEETLAGLSGKYQLVLATKGDITDQQRKIDASGLSRYFNDIEIIADKKDKDYMDLFKRIGAPADECLMVGNSMMSDIVPALNVGAKAAYIPYHVTWQYEKHPKSESGIESPNYVKLSSIKELTTILH